MAVPDSIDELRHRFAAQPRRYFASLANALRRSGALEEAVTILRAHLAEWPDHLTGHVVLGQALFDTGALAEARAAFETARSLDPGNSVVLRQLGEIASLAGDPESARVWFGRLRAADPVADDIDAQLGAAGVEPQYPDERAPTDALTTVDPEQEIVVPAPPAAVAAADAAPVVADGTPASEFELLEFDPVLPSEPALDPVVGLDVAPPETGHDDAAARVLPADMHDDAPSLDQIASGPFATETMAGLLAAQGHTDQAVALYERLTAERPGDAALRARLDALRGTPSVAPAAATPAADAAPVASPGAVEPTAAEPVTAAPPVAAEPARFVAEDDAARGALLAQAFAVIPGYDAPVAPELAGSAPDETDAYADVSFDRFFVEDAGPTVVQHADAVPTVPPIPTTPVAQADAGDDADLARFDDWLREVPA